MADFLFRERIEYGESLSRFAGLKLLGVSRTLYNDYLSNNRSLTKYQSLPRC